MGKETKKKQLANYFQVVKFFALGAWSRIDKLNNNNTSEA